MFSTEFLYEAQKTENNSLLRHLATICIFSLKIEKKLRMNTSQIK